MTSQNKLKELILDGLCTDGGHHKQWYLEQIAKELCIDYKEELGEEYEPEEGIAP